MPTIDENRVFTAIIEWEVPPEQQQALIDGVADEVEEERPEAIVHLILAMADKASSTITLPTVGLHP